MGVMPQCPNTRLPHVVRRGRRWTLHVRPTIRPTAKSPKGFGSTSRAAGPLGSSSTGFFARGSSFRPEEDTPVQMPQNSRIQSQDLVLDERPGPGSHRAARTRAATSKTTSIDKDCAPGTFARSSYRRSRTAEGQHGCETQASSTTGPPCSFKVTIDSSDSIFAYP